MSRRKDRERFLAMKRENPDYVGFRNSDQDSIQTVDAPYQAVVCSRCGKKRNVAPEVAQEQGANYVCMSCLEEGGAEVEQPEEVNA